MLEFLLGEVKFETPNKRPAYGEVQLGTPNKRPGAFIS